MTIKQAGVSSQGIEIGEALKRRLKPSCHLNFWAVNGHQKTQNRRTLDSLDSPFGCNLKLIVYNVCFFEIG